MEPDLTLRITEIFYSLQGESRTIGYPTTFIRLTGCPLRCRYCDTPYAFQGGRRMSLAEVLAAVRVHQRPCRGDSPVATASGDAPAPGQGGAGQGDLPAPPSDLPPSPFALPAARFGPPPPFVTVTGGEPLAQPACRELLRALCDAGYRVSLETSGALDISGVDERVEIVMDMKTPGSGEVERNRYRNLSELAATSQVKFVLCDRRDYEWARTRLQEWNLASRCEVLFLPVGNPALDTLSPRALADWILADGLPVRMQIQLHKVLWGDEAGR
uniref:7-carboxy-7-deazaguanine synthase n=1 Tax=Candidatus Kentrum sp. DK TaxID=2126562 RepID=A0A450SS74_9GAMM|nr:MAG: 7-carboxy-7-deazaguanine synthase [Candidatus Kentron sp. DK]